jgi:hypothetical protein
MYRILAEIKNEILTLLQIEIRPLGIRSEGAAILSPPGRLDFSASESTPQKKSQKIRDLN